MITKFSSKERREKFMHRAVSNMDIFPKEKLQKNCLQHKLLSLFIKVSNIKFQENPSSGCPVGTCEETDGRKDEET
jgi:hypothetical protein